MKKSSSQEHIADNVMDEIAGEQVASMDRQASGKLEGRESIDKVREILFGSLQREQQSRFLRLERSLQALAESSADQLQARTALLETRLEELSHLEDDRNAFLIRRVDQVEAAARSELTQELRALSEQLSELRRSLREEFTRQCREVEKELRETGKRLDSELAELRKEKTNREDLADYLLQVSLRLRGDADLEYVESTIQGMPHAGNAG